MAPNIDLRSPQVNEGALSVRDRVPDLEQTRRWYNEQRSGLGDEFLVSLADAFTRLEQDPERYRALYRGFRRVLVDRFLTELFIN